MKTKVVKRDIFCCRDFHLMLCEKIVESKEEQTEATTMDCTDELFVWQKYLEAKKSEEVPQILFPHVEATLRSGIEVGMCLEVPHQEPGRKETSFWVAFVTMVCGPLLRLRYIGGDERSLEFWFNLTKETAHELGWCEKNKKKLEPPEEILKNSPNCAEKLAEFLKTATTVSQDMLLGDENNMIDRIKQGMKVEVCDPQHPYKLWMATIIGNFGGRLKLRYDTPGELVEEFWTFCTSESLQQYKFAKNSTFPWFLEPPTSIKGKHTYDEWIKYVMSYPVQQETPKNLFCNQIGHERHGFEVGMKLEAICPANKATIRPATVVKVFDEKYFLVMVDSINDETDFSEGKISGDASKSWLCSADHPYIFPVGYAKKHDIRMSHPEGWLSDSDDFVWEEYLKQTNSSAASESLFPERQSAEDAGIICGMHLEAVNPKDKNVICAAHVTRVVDDLLWLKLDSHEEALPEHAVCMNSSQIFPVGWCESNRYPLKPPWDHEDVCRKLQAPLDESKKNRGLDPQAPEPRFSSWCPKIYFNYRCFTGPMISKGKLATLPKSVGPGPVVLVMKEVLSMIVSVGYRSARILKVLQSDTKPEPGHHLEVLKAKHKNNTYRANVAIVTSGDMVAAFCRNICKKLMVCPNLFGPLHVPEDNCPERCHSVSKTKFTTPIGSGRRGKPKGYTSIMVQKPKPWGGRRKRRRGRWANREKNRLEEFEFEEEMPYISMDLTKHVSDVYEDADDERIPLSEIVAIVRKGSEKSDVSDEVKNEGSSNVSEDSGSSFNEGKRKDVESPSSSGAKSLKENQNELIICRLGKRERECDTSIESDFSDDDLEYKLMMSQRRPKTRKLESNPLFWSVEDVFRYLRKTSDCKDIAYLVKQEEIDGLAFLLLNLPSLMQHMKLRRNMAMKLCRHVEQVKVTFFLRHINEAEPEQYQII